MEDAGERVVLAALRGKRYLGRLWALLLGSLWLLLLLAWRRLVGNGERAQHGELNGVVRDRVLLRMRFRVDSQRRAVDHRDLFGPNNGKRALPPPAVSAVELVVSATLSVVSECCPKHVQG